MLLNFLTFFKLIISDFIFNNFSTLKNNGFMELVRHGGGRGIVNNIYGVCFIATPTKDGEGSMRGEEGIFIVCLSVCLFVCSRTIFWMTKH